MKRSLFSETEDAMSNESEQIKAEMNESRRPSEPADISRRELLKQLKRQSRISFCIMLCTMIAAAALAVTAVFIVRISGEVQAVSAQLQDTAEQFQGTAEQIEKSLNELTPQAKTLMEQLGGASESLKEAADDMTEISNALRPESVEQILKGLGKFTDIDIEGLNDSIKGLSEIVSPLANLFRR